MDGACLPTAHVGCLMDSDLHLEYRHLDELLAEF